MSAVVQRLEAFKCLSANVHSTQAFQINQQLFTEIVKILYIQVLVFFCFVFYTRVCVCVCVYINGKKKNTKKKTNNVKSYHNFAYLLAEDHRFIQLFLIG